MVITTENLTKKYGSFIAVNEVSISIEKGSICGLIGRNGAGKTTLMRMLAGLIKPTSGSYVVGDGSEGQLAGIIETPSLHLASTVYENLVIQALMLGMDPNREALMKLLSLVSLDHVASEKAKNLSLGMKQRLAIAVCLVDKPKVLLLDEPTNGLDPQGIIDMRNLFESIAETGVTVLISSHILDELAKMATSYLFMSKGKIVATVGKDDLLTMSKPRTLIETDDNQKAVAILVENGYHGILGKNLEIDGKHNATEIIILLANGGVKVSAISTVGESLEDVFINIVGGGKC